MSKYFIYEGNLEKLDKKMTTIMNKCKKYNVDFKYERTGAEELRTVKDEEGNEFTSKFVEIEAEGFMQHANWEFIAKVDHRDEGNIIRQFNTEVEVPAKYRHTSCTCEHCNSNRVRKFTYLVHNTETDDWKQVGSSCLKEFTKGLDADYVAKFVSWFDYLIEGEKGCYRGVKFDPYHSTLDYLMYVKETVDRFGYLSKSDAYYNMDFGGCTRPTSERAYEYYAVGCLGRTAYMKSTLKEMEEIGLDDSIARRPENEEYVKNALEWIRNLEVKESDGFMYNLKLVLTEDYFPARDMGFVASLMPCYYRHLKDLAYEAKKRERAEKESKSEFVGEIKDRITFNSSSCECVYTYETIYGVSHIYKFTDDEGNIYTWSTGKGLDFEDDKTYQITGTVKDHTVYRGVKQTVLTRCKVA